MTRAETVLVVAALQGLDDALQRLAEGLQHDNHIQVRSAREVISNIARSDRFVVRDALRLLCGASQART